MQKLEQLMVSLQIKDKEFKELTDSHRARQLELELEISKLEGELNVKDAEITTIK